MTIDNGGTKKIADFPLFVDGKPVVSGVPTTLSANADRGVVDAYTVTETEDPEYVGSFSGDCTSAGVVYLHPGENACCILTNDDRAPVVVAPVVPVPHVQKPIVVAPVPPLIDLVKVPSSLDLPLGPGRVTYTYTLRNIGTVPVTDVQVTDDSCMPLGAASGDTNADGKLDMNETWVYTCATTLEKTHTNTAIATGWANNIVATDLASATVVVGVPVVPPLIHVTKIPSIQTVPVEGGDVMYTEKVTNPGSIPLENVQLRDSTCDPMAYVSGDTNADGKLDTDEMWVYTGTAQVTKTTTNTAIASGRGNGITIRDFAVATVTVAAPIPGLPDTGADGGGGDGMGVLMGGRGKNGHA